MTDFLTLNHKKKCLINKALALLMALTFLTLALSAGCSSRKEPKQLLKEGTELAKEKKFEQAAKKYYEYVKLKPKSEEGYLLLFAALVESGRKDEAYSILKQAKKEIPGSPAINIALGKFYSSKGQFEMAKEEYDLAIKNNPENPLPKALKAIILIGEENYKESYPLFKELISLDPKKSEDNKKAVTLAYTFLLEIIGMQGRTDDEAYSVITKGIQFIPDYSRGYAVLGIYFYKKGKIDSAIKRFEIALKKGEIAEKKTKGTSYNRESFLYRILGDIYYKRGETEKAEKYYEEFLKVYGSDGRETIENKYKSDIKVYQSIVKDNMKLEPTRNRLKVLKRN